MSEKDDGLGLGLSLKLGWGENDDDNNNNLNHHQQQQYPFYVHKPPQSVPNQRASFNNLFHFHDRSSETRSFLRGIDVNLPPPPPSAVVDDENAVSSPNSTISSISGKRSEREGNGDENERTSSSRGGGSDDDDGGACGGDGDGEASRKKLRLSKEQALVLEETFKEHNSLNPQKQALAKQLNLMPRQVEVWFQNRRARTKLKQTEVDCEYLKNCCENLTEENRRLQKEVQELRALKLSPQLYMNMNPPTTLTMCPSCERVAVSSTSFSSSATMPSAPPPANLNPAGPTIQRPVPVNPWAAMLNQHRGRP
uniref:Homeobox domain-containing protein n=1 Tax=Glycine max TaxID=3847 RepID=A0A0R0KI55_SOYBN